MYHRGTHNGQFSVEFYFYVFLHFLCGHKFTKHGGGPQFKSVRLIEYKMQWQSETLLCISKWYILQNFCENSFAALQDSLPIFPSSCHAHIPSPFSCHTYIPSSTPLLEEVIHQPIYHILKRGKIGRGR